MGDGYKFLFEKNKVFDSENLQLSLSQIEILENIILKNTDFFSILEGDIPLCKCINTNNVQSQAVHNRMTLDEKLGREFLNNPIPWYIVLELTTTCNLKCKHCYNHNDNSFIELDDIKKLFEMLDDNDNFMVCLTGGELFLHPNLFDILDYLQYKNKVIALMTNATLLDEEKISKLKEYNIDHFYVSLYSMDSAKHDEITGIKGSYDKTIKNLMLLKDNGFSVDLSALITPFNKEVEGLIEFARSMQMQMRFCFKCLSNCEDSCINSVCDLSTDEFSDVYKEYLSCFRKFELIKKNTYNDHVCMAAMHRCVLGADGSLFLCPSWKTDYFVNVRDIKNFNEFWYSDKVKNIRNVSKNTFKKCSSCVAKDYCRPCMAANYNKNGDILSLNESHCELELLKFKLEKEFVSK